MARFLAASQLNHMKTQIEGATMKSATPRTGSQKTVTGSKSANSSLRVKVGPERIILGDGLQPLMFQTKKGTLFLQAQTSPTPGFKPAKKNPISGYGH